MNVPFKAPTFQSEAPQTPEPQTPTLSPNAVTPKKPSNLTLPWREVMDRVEDSFQALCAFGLSSKGFLKASTYDYPLPLLSLLVRLHRLPLSPLLPLPRPIRLPTTSTNSCCVVFGVAAADADFDEEGKDGNGDDSDSHKPFTGILTR